LIGVKAKFVNVPWDQLVPALLRGTFDAAFNGLEITEDRRKKINFTVPCYLFSEQMTVRADTHEPAFVDRIAARVVKFGPECSILSDDRRLSEAPV
jgi:polar amino acid transport system substrate-binding protein